LKFLYSLWLCIICAPVLAQTYSGSVTDASTNEPVPYVNIGIVKKGIGTVTDENGKFTLELAETYLHDTLRISMIGYQTRNFLVEDLQKNFPTGNVNISLSQVATELKGVVVKPNKIKYAVLGNDFHSTKIGAGFQSNKLGSEIGIIMRIKKAPSYVDRVNFHIAQNKYDSAIWRVNIYMLEDGKPGENMLKQPIYLKSFKSNEDLSVDLAPYLIEVNGDFVVALELIEDLGELGLSFCAGIFGNSMFVRVASQGEWQKVPLGVGFTATVSYGY
jgi:hypothetical protein